jgi:hypothetical protein
VSYDSSTYITLRSTLFWLKVDKPEIVIFGEENENEREVLLNKFHEKKDIMKQ